ACLPRVQEFSAKSAKIAFACREGLSYIWLTGHQQGPPHPRANPCPLLFVALPQSPWPAFSTPGERTASSTPSNIACCGSVSRTCSGSLPNRRLDPHLLVLVYDPPPSSKCLSPFIPMLPRRPSVAPWPRPAVAGRHPPPRQRFPPGVRPRREPLPR